jgi:SynChlorMet cassette radical SAM/SPASM protein ScmF
MGEKTETSGRVRAYPLNMLYFYLTEGCNLRCRHCWLEPKFQTGKRQYAALDPGLFRHIVRQAKPLGLTGVKLTGGEPFLHPGIGEIIGVVREEDLNLHVETNGTLCTPEIARALAACGGINVAVSLDGTDAHTHEWVRGVEGCFEASVSGIKHLVEAGIRPQVIMTLMRRNADKMEAMVRLAESIGASSVKFNIVQPTARGERMREAGETITIEELVRLGIWAEDALARGTGLPLFYSHPVAFRPLGRIYGNGGVGCGVCGILGILGVLADGTYALCGVGEHIPDLVFGHAASNPLRDVWAEAPVLREIREGLPWRLGGICGGCVMKGICRGGCIAQNYYKDGTLWSPFWFCEEAEKAGLFPETRKTTTGARPEGRSRFPDCRNAV